jgi:hypothetical protein
MVVMEMVTNVDDDGDTILKTLLDIVTDVVDTVTDGDETILDTVTDLLDTVTDLLDDALDLLAEHDESVLDLIDSPVKDVGHVVEGAGDEVSSLVDGDTDGGANDDGDSDGDLDDLDGSVDDEVEDILSEAEVGEVTGDEHGALELGGERVDLVLDPRATDAASVAVVEHAGDLEQHLTLVDHHSDLNKELETTVTVTHESVTDEVHDVVVDLEGGLVLEMRGGVHASTEVDRVEVAV